MLEIENPAPQPNSSEILKNRNFLLILVGPTASGKDTLLNEVSRKNNFISRLISHTSRSIRSNETNGVDYFYIDTPTFESQLTNFIAITTRIIDGKTVYYGIQKKDLDRVLKGEATTLSLDLKTAINFKEELERIYSPDEVDKIMKLTVIVYVGTNSLITLKTRYFNRARENNDKKIFLDRLANDWKNWNQYKDQITHTVINHGQLQNAYNQLINLLNNVLV